MPRFRREERVITADAFRGGINSNAAITGAGAALKGRAGGICARFGSGAFYLLK